MLVCPKLRYQSFLCLFSPMRRVLATAGEPIQRGAGVEWDSLPALLDLPMDLTLSAQLFREEGMNKHLNPTPAVELKCGLHTVNQHHFPVLSDWTEDLGGTSSWRRGCETSGTVWSFRGRKLAWGRSQRLTGERLHKLIQGVATASFPTGSQLARTCSLHHS